jgi:hypothetical protein
MQPLDGRVPIVTAGDRALGGARAIERVTIFFETASSGSGWYSR